jgi:hypothetical protein
MDGSSGPQNMGVVHFAMIDEPRRDSHCPRHPHKHTKTQADGELHQGRFAISTTMESTVDPRHYQANWPFTDVADELDQHTACQILPRRHHVEFPRQCRQAQVPSTTSASPQTRTSSAAITPVRQRALPRARRACGKRQSDIHTLHDKRPVTYRKHFARTTQRLARGSATPSVRK